MALTGMTFIERMDYILEIDPAQTEADGATIFEIGSLPADIRTNIQDDLFAMHSDGSVATKTNSAYLKAVRFGLKGVRNYRDPKNKEIKFTTMDVTRFGSQYTIPDDAFLATLPSHAIKALGQRIMKENAVSDEERKKSPTQS